MKTFTLCLMLLMKMTTTGLAAADSPPGPVYVSPDPVYESPEPAATRAQQPDSRVTQTVYGFLDFTTTIGDTVMVFMPQSASAAPGATAAEQQRPSAAAETTTAAAAETTTADVVAAKPTAADTAGPADISPSRPVTAPADRPAGETSAATTTTKSPAKKPTGVPAAAKKTAAKPAVATSPKPEPAARPVTAVTENAAARAGSDAVPEPSAATADKAVYSRVEVIAGEPVAAAEVAVNHLQPTPEYDFLSRQPSEVVDETFRVIDLKPGGPRHATAGVQKSRGPDGKPRAFNSVAHFDAGAAPDEGAKAPKKPAVKPSASTSGAARILKTAAPKPASRSPNVEPTPAAGTDDESLEPLAGSQPGAVLVRQSRRPAVGGHGKNKYGGAAAKSNRPDDYYSTTAAAADSDGPDDYEQTTAPSYRNKGGKYAAKGGSTTTQRTAGFKQNRFGRPTTTGAPEPESAEGPAPPPRRFQPSAKRYENSQNGNGAASVVTPANRRTFKKHFQPQEQSPQPVPTAPLAFKSKLVRPTGRWEYKTSPKPRVTIRRIDENRHGAQDNATTPLTPHFPDVQVDSGDQALAGSGLLPALQHDDDNDVVVQDVSPTASAETIRVEISTPADFKDVYYEIATIKSPYSFQVGSVKNTRFITVTSTIQKSLVEQTESPAPARVEPLSENILASQAPNAYGRGVDQQLGSSVATLPPIALSPDQATPPLETMTESFSTTELMLKTHVLPVVRGTDTSTVTLIQSYRVTRLVTAVKTLPPMEVYQFVPSKTLNEFNTRLDEAGSELHLELEYGDDEEQQPSSHPNAAKAFLDSLDLANVGSNFDLSQMDRSADSTNGPRSKKAHRMAPGNSTAQRLLQPQQPQQQQQQQQVPTMSPEQLQQLALYRLLNPNVPLPAPVLTTTRPVLRLETVYETHALPVVNGGSTYYTTLSRPVATATRTDYELVTTTLAVPQMQPPFPQQLLPPQMQPPFPQQLPPVFAGQQQQQQQQQQQAAAFAVTSTPVVTQSMVTQTDSRVLKLTFGAKTAYTTIYSSSVVPTQVTSYITQSVAVQPTVSPFPNFIPYGGYPFLG